MPQLRGVTSIEEETPVVPPPETVQVPTGRRVVLYGARGEPLVRRIGYRG